MDNEPLFDPRKGRGAVSIQPGPFWILKDGHWEYSSKLHNSAGTRAGKISRRWKLSYDNSERDKCRAREAEHKFEAGKPSDSKSSGSNSGK